MRNAISSETVEELEQQLALSLRRIEPNPEFVHHLHYRLKTPAAMSVERRQSLGMSLLLAALSLTTGLLFVWLLKQLRAA